MARASALAAGGIVLRREQPPRIALVRLRKRDEWVLPKGKLDDGETPRAAARREVLEETGHNVTVQEFLGTLVYDSGGRSKVVHYWRMEAGSEQVRELMHDVRAVEWLPLEAAVARLSRGYERVFLENVGPIAVSAMARQQKEKAKRREAAVAAPQLPLTVPAPPVERAPMPEAEPALPLAAEPDIVLSPLDADELAAPEATAAGDETMPPRHQRASFAERVRNWLGRAA
jgi:8-oxo-dGTP diphosphatase